MTQSIKSKAIYESGVETDNEGARWLPPIKSADLLGVHEKTLQKWGRSCPWLDGSGINTRTFGDGVRHYRESQLLKICDARVNLTSAPEIPGHIYIDTLCSELNVSRSTLSGRLRAINKKTVPFDGKATNGRLRPFSYVTDATKATLMEQEQTTPGLVTRKEAEAILGCSDSCICKLLKSGKLEYVSGYLLSRAAVGKLAAARKNNPPRAGYRWEEAPEKKHPWRGKADTWLKTHLSKGPRFLPLIEQAGLKVGLGIAALRAAFGRIKRGPFLSGCDRRARQSLWTVAGILVPAKPRKASQGSRRTNHP